MYRKLNSMKYFLEDFIDVKPDTIFWNNVFE